jgi:GDP-L-fucose synthase
MRVLVAGSTGLVGSAIARALKAKNHEVIPVNTKVVNLLDRKTTFAFLSENRPDAVIDAAARVGGIGANNANPVEFLSNNIQIQTNLMDASHEVGVNRFVFLGSSCIYPRDAMQPIKEEYLLAGPLEQTNSAYAIAKIAGIELIRSYRREYGRQWISLMPTNLYGPGDNFNLETSHVLPALIRKFVDAVREKSEIVSLWGSGTPRREFLYVDDLAEATWECLERYDDDRILNIGTGVDISIKDLAEKIAEFSGFKGVIDWDHTKPDGTPRKLLDTTRLTEFGWRPKVSLDDGILRTITWYRENYGEGRTR